MVNSSFKLLKTLKAASLMNASRNSFMPPEPLPNSVKAKQLEAQQILADQTEEASVNSEGQLMDMQKAQQDAVNQVQQAQQEIQKLQGELQNAQATSQQQAAAAQMDAQQQIQKAQADAQAAIQEEKIKSQMKVLSMQEKYTKMQSSAKPNQNHILSNQLKRVTKKVQSLSKIAKTIDIEVELISSKKASIQQEPVNPGTVKMPLRPEERAAKLQFSKQKMQEALAEHEKTQPTMRQSIEGEMNTFLQNPVQYNKDNPGNIMDPWDANEQKNHSMIGNWLHNGAAAAVNFLPNSFARMGSNLAGGIGEGLRGVRDIGKGIGQAATNTGRWAQGVAGTAFAPNEEARNKAWNSMASDIAGNSTNDYFSNAAKHFGTGARNFGSYAGEAASWALGGRAGWAATAPLRNMASRVVPGMAGKAVGVAGSLAPSALAAEGAQSLGNSAASGFQSGAAAPYSTNIAPAGEDLNTAAQGYDRWKSGNINKTVPATGTLTNPNDYKLEKRVKGSAMPIMQNTGYMGHNPEKMPTNFLGPQSQGYGQIGDFIASILYRNVVPGLMPQPDIARFQKSLYAPTNSYMRTQ